MISLNENDYINVSDLYNSILDNMTEDDLEGVFSQLLEKANDLKTSIELYNSFNNGFLDDLKRFLSLKSKDQLDDVFINLMKSDSYVEKCMRNVYIKENIYFNIKEKIFTTTGVINETILVSNLNIDLNYYTFNTGIPMYIMKYSVGIFSESEFRNMFFKSVVRRFTNNLKKNVDFNRTQHFQYVVDCDIVINMLNDDDLLRELNRMRNNSYNSKDVINYISNDKFKELLPTIIRELNVDKSTLGKFEFVKFSNYKIMKRIYDFYDENPDDFNYSEILKALTQNSDFARSEKLISILNDDDFEILVSTISKNMYNFDKYSECTIINYSFGSIELYLSDSDIKKVSQDLRFNTIAGKYFKDNFTNIPYNGIPFNMKTKNSYLGVIDLIDSISKILKIYDDGGFIPEIKLENFSKNQLLRLVESYNSLDDVNEIIKYEIDLEKFNEHILPLL